MNTTVYTEALEPRIGYLELQVSDLAKSLSFYQEFIGFSLLEREGNTAKLTTDGATPQLVLTEEEAFVPRPNRTTGLYHYAVLVPTRQDLALWFRHAVQEGYPLQGASDHQYSEAIYLADPDGNGIEVYADRDPNQWERDGRGGYIGGTAPLDLQNLLAEIKEKEWSGLPSGTRIGHMHLQVTSIAESEKFYIDALGFDILAKDTHMLFVSKDAYHHHIGMNTWEGQGLPQPPEHALGLKQFTIHFTEEEFLHATSQLDQLGYVYRENNQQIEVTDPSGNKLRIVAKK
ncbi:VOC family protein [Paenibacillus turpanensis]|uniref:VOC family protein n=1 Tax=Paenibacillus turpanensis TaxID=2689078 RepID=UPI00140BB3E1|nr:VOC family protein [Paenibacillus turpanensis]